MLEQEGIMHGLGVLAVIVYLAIVVFIITLLNRFVNAVENIAHSMKNISDKFQR